MIKLPVILSIDKDKYLKNETSTSGNTNEDVCVCCHDRKRLDPLEYQKN